MLPPLPQDRPKILGDPKIRAERVALLNEPHLQPLTAFVDALRAEAGPDVAIPNFDPWDGGVAAEVLYFLEAPGAKAVTSGFISRNNPDETAKNFFELNEAAGIPRRRTVTWNVVPWYIGSGKRIRPAGNADIVAGIRPLERLLDLLPKLRVIVLIGRKAERAAEHISDLRPELKIFRTPHPSPLFINNAPGNRKRILGVLQEVRQFLAI